MAPEGPLFSLVLLLPILVPVSWAGKKPSSYQNFLREHVDFRRVTLSPHTYCQEKMMAQGLTSPACTKKNTFIHALNSHVKIICGAGGHHINHTLSDSLASYIITTCYFRGGNPPKHCKYRGQSERRRIRVACFRRVPVDFKRILITWP